MGAELKAEMETDWCDVLGQYLISEVEDGIKALFVASKGKLRSINEFQVQDQVEIALARQVAKLPADPSPPLGANKNPDAEARREFAQIVLKGFGQNARG